MGGEWKEKNRKGKFWPRGIEKLRQQAADHGHEFTVLSKVLNVQGERSDHESLREMQTGEGHERVPNSTPCIPWQERAQNMRMMDCGPGWTRVRAGRPSVMGST